MTPQLVIGIVFFCVAMTGCAIGNISMYKMIDEINRSIHRSQSLTHFGFWAGKNLFIMSEYRRLYPEGKLHGRTWASIATMIAGLTGVAICMMVRFR